MKKSIIIYVIAVIALCVAYCSVQAQTWKPNPMHIQKKDSAKTSTVQCWGTTKQNTRCRHKINPKAPNNAVMDAGGVYYCSQHAYQANQK